MTKIVKNISAFWSHHYHGLEKTCWVNDDTYWEDEETYWKDDGTYRVTWWTYTVNVKTYWEYWWIYWVNSTLFVLSNFTDTLSVQNYKIILWVSHIFCLKFGLICEKLLGFPFSWCFGAFLERHLVFSGGQWGFIPKSEQTRRLSRFFKGQDYAIFLIDVSQGVLFSAKFLPSCIFAVCLTGKRIKDVYGWH